MKAKTIRDLLDESQKDLNKSKELFKDKNHYKLLKSNRRFDYLPNKNRKHEPLKMYNLKFRVVRFKISEEIYARLIMYNYFELIISQTVIQQQQRKYVYMINFSVAAHICREFFLKLIPPDDIEALIARYLTPVRPDRSRPRKMSLKAPISFLYRVA